MWISRRRRSSLTVSQQLEAQVRALFAAGEQGGWWDPSDLSTLFQDSAGTTPVTAAGQPVGMMRDKSGRANHLVEAVASNRPLLQQSAGLWFLAFDGVDDSLATSGNVDFSATDAVTCFAGLRKLSDAARGKVVELGPPTATGTFGLEAPTNVGPSYSFNSQGSAQVFATSNGFAAPHTAVLTGQGKIGTDQAVLRVNGAQVASLATDQGTGNYSSAAIFVGRRSSSLPFNGNIYGLIVRGAASSAAQVSSGEAWCNLKAGAF